MPMKVKTGGREQRAKARLDAVLLEKYCHSRAALLREEGQFTRAIRFFKRSLRLDDRPAIRCDLAMAYLGNGEPDKALREINRAITRAPDVAEYYNRRSVIWQAKGNSAKADEDERIAVRLDRNYERIGRIRASAAALQRIFFAEPFHAGNLADVRDRRLRAVVTAADSLLLDGDRALCERSCIVPCPAYCCHFGHEPIVHGVWIGAWKLRAVREYLKDKGVRERDFIAALPVHLKGYVARLIPPHVVMRQSGREVVFYPPRARTRLGRRRMNEAPKAIDYRDVAWFTADARACIFLREGRCMIHDVGGEPALTSCKEFFCLTGLVFLVLGHLGMVSEAELKEKSMAVLNQAAVEGLLLLHDRIYGDETELSAMRADMRQTLVAAVHADAAGASPKEIEAAIDRYRRQENGYRQRLSIEQEFVARQVRKMISGEKA